MILPASILRAALLVCAPALAILLSAALTMSAAQAGASARSKSQQSFPRASVSGSYLAARHAGVERDAAAASLYYRAALRRDPRNSELLNRAFIAVLANGEMDEAVRLAERVVQSDKTDRIARLVLGIRGIKAKQYGSARTHLAQAARGPINDLAATLLLGWTHVGPKDSRNAVEAIDKLAGPDWYALFKDVHVGLILDLSGHRRDALKRLERAYKLDTTAMRVAQAYASQLARTGNRDEALKVYRTLDDALPRHPMVRDGLRELEAGRRLPQIVDSPQAGAAEVLHGLGAALGRRGGEDLALVYLQLALYLVPNHALSLTSLADLYEAMKKPAMAIKTYSRIAPASPLFRHAQIQRAFNLDALDRTDEAKALLTKLIDEEPSDRDAILALGNIQRARKQFAECADVYGKAIDTITRTEKSNWVIYYFRGICYERSKQWPKAELDMQQALKLYPDHPLVLNYLGYSWVDQGVHLDEGMRMIKRAVEQRPDDGYIVDSLGWAYYRLGNYEEAVKHLEHAVELKPEDPTINDHLGDAYWKVGRRLEAQFQWTHARDLKPEPDELEKIEAKLKSGLAGDLPTTTSADNTAKPGGG